MNRHVVAVSEDDDKLTVALMKAPVNIKDARKAKPFGCDPDTMPPWQTAGAVRLHGSTLYDQLVAAHPAINQVLTTALQTPNQTPALYFHLFSDEAERFSWESLYEQQNGFLALQCEWAIARMADSSADLARPPASFDGPLRLMALLSAHNQSAEPEWQQLKTAVTDARQSGWPVTLSVLVGEEAVFDQIEQEIAAEGLADVSAVPLPQTTEAIKDLVNNFAPHILHFFAHGAVGFGTAALQMAHFGDAGQSAGSIMLSVSELLRFKALRDVWLVTLNCCETGRATPDMHSMAHRLVADGVPAALGMMEPIAPRDAHRICGAFYQSIFKYLGRALTNPTSNVEIEWSQVLHPTRSALKDLHIKEGQPDTRREWTLPVLYVRPESFFVVQRQLPGPAPAPVPAGAPPPPAPITAPDSETRLRIDVVAGFLRSQPPDAPDALRIQALAMLTGVPEEFKPDKFGAFRTQGATAVTPAVANVATAAGS